MSLTKNNACTSRVKGNFPLIAGNLDTVVAYMLDSDILVSEFKL